MKRLILALSALAFVAVTAFAHEGNDHIRGTVTKTSEQTVTVQTADKTPKTITVTLTPKTTFQRAGKAAKLADVKVGDRVVVDVPEGKLEALLIQIGTAPPAAAKPAK